MTDQHRLAGFVITLFACLVFTMPAFAGTASETERLEELTRWVEEARQTPPPQVSLRNGASYQPPGREKQDYGIVDDRVVVKLKADFAKQASALPLDRLPEGLEPFDLLLEQHQVQQGHRLARPRGKPLLGEKLDAYVKHGMDRLYVLELAEPGEEAVHALVDRLSREPWVEYAEPATYGVPLFVPNDTFYSSQWAHNNTGQSGGTVDADMDTEEAWDTTTGRRQVVIAVADTGTLIAHPDLDDSLVRNCGNSMGTCFDFGNNDYDPTPSDGSTHGTNSGGIMAAEGNNAMGVAGTCYNCSLMALKTCVDFGGCTSLAFQDAIIHAANNGAKVINMSFCYGWSQAWVDAVDTARDMGTLSFASLGNATSVQACVPATVPNALAIGGTGRNDQRIFAVGSHQFVTAPGTGIYSTSNAGATPTYNPSFGGTSASSPFAAAVSGLLWSHDTSLHVNEVEALLSLGADDEVGPPSEDVPGFDPFFGHGRVNAKNSIDLVDQEWINIRQPHHVCGGTLTIGYHNPAGCDGQTVTVTGDVGGDSVTLTLSQVTGGGYCEATVDANWALLDSVDLFDSMLTIEHGETVTATKGSVSDISVADCERDVCHWSGRTDWNFRELIRGDCDDDGALDPGHLVRIAPAFVNTETEPMSDAVMVLSTDSPYLDIVVDALSFSGDLPPFTGFTTDPDDDPMFTIRVLPGAPPNSVAEIDVTLFSPGGWINDTDGCSDFESSITIPLNRDTGALVQEWDFDDGTAQGWTSAASHGTTTLSECSSTWDGNEWNSVPTTDNPHQGAYAMRMGNGTSYATGTDSALESPVVAVPTDGVLGFRIFADTEVAGSGFAYDAVAMEGKNTTDTLWSPLPVPIAGSFSSESNLIDCFAAGFAFPFGLVERTPMLAGDGAADTPFGDAYEYEHLVPLTPLSGQSGQVRFRFGSDDDSVENSGVWVDTVRLYQSFTADTWPGLGPDDVSGSDVSCPTQYDVTAAAVPGAVGYNLYRSTESCEDAFISPDLVDTSATPTLTDGAPGSDVGYFYTVEAVEGGTTCPGTRVCFAGGCCSTLPDDPTGLLVEIDVAGEKLSWDDPGGSGVSWFLYHDTDKNPATWGPAAEVDIADEDSGTAGIQHTTALPTPPPGGVTYTLITAIDCGESPLVD